MENGKRLDSVREIQKALCSFRPNEHVIIGLYEQDVEPHVEGDVTFEARVFSGDSLEEVEARLRKFTGERGLRPRTNIVYRLQCRPDSGLTIRQLNFMDALIFERNEIESVRCGGSINAEQEEKIRLTVLFSTPTPVMMYLHGFMSGANGAKQRQLQERFKGRYRVIAPELDADPESSLEIINREIERVRPEIIIGTSLGGFMALECKPGNADLVIVNPCLFPQKQLAQWVGEEHTYFCKRLDGVQTYTLTQETLDKYGRYDAVESVKRRAPYVAALCSTADELLGDSHVKALTGLLRDDFLVVVDDFGHQCKDAGMTHLYDLIDRVIDRRRMMGRAPRTLTDFELMVRNRPIPDTRSFYRLTVRSYKPARCRRVPMEAVNGQSDDTLCETPVITESTSAGISMFRLPNNSHNANIYHPESSDHATIGEAVEAMRARIGQPGIFDFEIRRLPFGEISQRRKCVEALMFAPDGRLIQSASCSAVHNGKPGIHGKFFGHLPDKLPYKKGDIVIVFHRLREFRPASAVLGVIVKEPQSVRKGYEHYRRLMKRRLSEGMPMQDWLDETDYPGCDKDRYMVLTGPLDNSMAGISYHHPIDVYPVRFPVRADMKYQLLDWYHGYLDALEKNPALLDRIAMKIKRGEVGIEYSADARTRVIFGDFFKHERSTMFKHINEIVADPAQASARLPLAYNYVGGKVATLGAYLTWWRTNGHAPDHTDPEEWDAFLSYNENFPTCDNPMIYQKVAKLYDCLLTK